MALAEFLAAQPPAGAPAGWQALAQAWQASLPDGVADPCAQLASEGLRCYRQRRASLNLLRLLDRPVLLTLHAATDTDTETRAMAVLLRHLDADRATLAGAGGTTLQLPVADLAPLWRGEIATLWRTPANLPHGDDAAASAAGAAWLDRRLAVAGAGSAGAGPMTPERRRARIHQFQLSQGLTPDGRAGPMTLMMLNHATGVQEPRLRSGG